MDREYADIDNIFKNRDAKVTLEYYDRILKNNVSSHGATTKRVKKDKKQISKTLFRKITIGIIALATATTLISSRNIKKNSAIDYVNKELIPEIMMKIDGENEKERTLFIIEEMQRKGFSEEQAVYFLKESFGNTFFDLAAKALMSDDGKKFLIEKGYVYNVVSSSGETIYQTFANENMFDREVGPDFIETTNELRGRGK